MDTRDSEAAFLAECQALVDAGEAQWAEDGGDA
jgi:hypothetical protein